MPQTKRVRQNGIIYNVTVDAQGNITSAVPDTQVDESRPPDLLSKPPGEGPGQLISGDRPFTFTEAGKSFAKHLPELLPYFAGAGGPALVGRGLRAIPQLMGLTGTASVVGNLAAGNDLGTAAEQGALDATLYSAIPELMGKGIELAAKPIVKLGLRGKINPKAVSPALDPRLREEATDQLTNEAADTILKENIGTIGKARRLDAGSAQATDRAAALIDRQRQRNVLGRFTTDPAVSLDPLAVGRAAAEGVQAAKGASPRVPLNPGIKTAADRDISNFIGDPDRPLRVGEAVKDLRNLRKRGGPIDPFIGEATQATLNKTAPAVGQLANKEILLDQISKALSSRPRFSPFEAAAVGGGALGSSYTGDASPLAGGLTIAALMHAAQSPLAYARTGLAVKGASKAGRELMRGSTFLKRDPTALDQLLSALSQDDQ